jgi:hypothetical protein
MTLLAHDLARTLGVGIGATAILDLWIWLLKRLAVPSLDFALVGRWLGHLARGRWRHDAIAKAAPVPGERALGWAFHYAVGVAFAGALVGVAGASWLNEPRPLPALLVGVATVAAPLLVMQPAMGAGLASRRTRTPLRNCLRSLVNHSVFGAGLYLAALALAALEGTR